jgi:hypothetical protein
MGRIRDPKVSARKVHQETVTESPFHFQDRRYFIWRAIILRDLVTTVSGVSPAAGQKNGRSN